MTSTAYIRVSGAKTLLLVAALAVLLAACGGTAPAEWSATAAAVDAIAPSAPTGLTAAAAGSSVINLSWTASTDNIAVAGYVVSRNGKPVATPATTSYKDTGLSPATPYSYSVAAVDAAGNVSPDSTNASATTAAGPDTVPPSTPTGLTAAATGSSSINLSWNASSDNVGVTGYIVRRAGIQVATPAATSYTDTGLSAGTTYSYTVAAVDASGNNSPFTTPPVSATTTGTPPPTTIPPTLGWFQIPSTQLRSVCAGDHGFPQVLGNTGCSAVTGAWSGGVFDAARNRLVMWGGGHTDYAGNEVYALELDTLMLKRLNDPSTTVRDAGCSFGGTYADGKPGSRHTYNHLAYLPNQDALFAWGGSLYQCGSSDGKGWLLNFSNLTWTATATTNGPGGGTFNNGAAYDPNNGLVYMYDWNDLRSYNPVTNTWSKRSSAQFSSGDAIAAVVDPVRKKYFFSVNGSTTLHWYDISSATASVPPQSSPTTGCGGFLNDANTGIEYDPVQDRIVGWNGGNTVYLLNPDTFSCTTVTTTGGPASAQTGTFGRFRYSPSLNLFAVCNSVDANCFTLRLTP